jgi:hypothetical protein
LLLLGIVSGHEAVRTLVMLLAWISTAVGSVMLVLAVLALPLVIASSGAGSAALALTEAVISVAVPGYVLWCLRQQDVQKWMMRRSLNLSDE